jgi:hypothetical protein
MISGYQHRKQKHIPKHERITETKGNITYIVIDAICSPAQRPNQA